jgi:hypothetical protein
MRITYPGFTASAALVPRGQYGGAPSSAAVAPGAIVAAQEADCAESCCGMCECCANTANSGCCNYCTTWCVRTRVVERGAPVYLTE